MEQQYEPPTTKLALQSDKCYHVFLSFRGPDVRKTLVQDLFDALSAAGLYVFIDSEELQKGEVIELSLKKAIDSSAIRIPVFSKGYAESTWCLKEAAAMLNTPGLIIPLFYDVDPTHVRYPQGNNSPYRESFLKHYGHSDRYKGEEVDEWKRALHQICSRSGWSMDITQPGFEARLVKTVVNDLIKTLDRVPLEVARYPVGMDTVKNDILQKLNLNSKSEVVKVGIWGIGGIGKTTVAKAVYNQVYADFDVQCFVFNVRATAAQGLEKLQKQILRSLCNYNGEVDSVDHGISLFRDRLGGKRVLLILDDVDADEQLKALVGDWLAPGSRLIVTTRDRHILHLARVSSECIHEMGGLEINEGLQLFSWHAFLRESPNPSYEDLSERIVKACKGHPLSLEVTGSFLYDNNDPDCWTEALNNITRNPKIHERLEISYRALSYEEKEIFLDIACFFVGEDKTCPMLFWKSLNYKMVHTAVSNLSLKLLIKIEKGVFGMHDHLQDMGRSMAEKEQEGTRLWEAAQLSTISYNFSRVRLNGGNLQRLKMLCRPGLHYLHLQNQSMVLPSSIWLRLKNCLRCLHLQSQPIEDPLATVLPSLIWLRLEGCYFDSWMNRAIKRPRHFRCANNICQLKTLQLISCVGVSSHSISSIFSIPNIQLQHLELRGCGSLYKLPDTIGNLSQLQHLNLAGCGSLNNLPDTIDNLSQLKYFYR